MDKEGIKLAKDKVAEKARTGRVITDYQAVYPDPITMRAGEALEMSGKEDNWNGWIWVWCTNQQGKSGWVPKGYVEQTGTTVRARFDYEARELSVSVGEELIVEKEESGWMWCTNVHGKSGWVPAEHVACW